MEADLGPLHAGLLHLALLRQFNAFGERPLHDLPRRQQRDFDFLVFNPEVFRNGHGFCRDPLPNGVHLVFAGDIRQVRVGILFAEVLAGYVFGDEAIPRILAGRVLRQRVPEHRKRVVNALNQAFLLERHPLCVVSPHPPMADAASRRAFRPALVDRRRAGCVFDLLDQTRVNLRDFLGRRAVRCHNPNCRVHFPDLARDLAHKLRQAVDGQAGLAFAFAFGPDLFRPLIPDQIPKIVLRAVAVVDIRRLRLVNPLSGGGDDLFFVHQRIHPPRAGL